MKKQILITALLSAVALTAGAAQAQDRGERPDFATLDADGNGSITLAELQAQRAAKFAERDTNGDGSLSADELAAEGAAKASDRAEKMLERLDSNEDGVLQEAELNERGNDRLERMFERVDADEDGSLTEDEFEAAKDQNRGRRGGHGEGRGSRGRG